MSPPVETGLDRALREPPKRLRDARAFALLSNQASVTRGFAHAADAMLGRFPESLRALFGPQHGLWSTEQDNMIETEDAIDDIIDAYDVRVVYERPSTPQAQIENPAPEP